MYNPNKIKQTLDYYFYPFSPYLNEKTKEIKSIINLELDEELFSIKNLERIVEELNYHMITKENIAPEVGEILATQIIDYNISNRTIKHEKSTSNLIKILGKSGYNINSSQNYIAKITHGHNVVILRKGENENKQKFNFNVAAEIDGLYLVKRENELNKENSNSKIKKVFYPIETKTGTTSISKEHIFEDIILPLKEMYKTEINYVMVGFESRMYKNQDKRIFNNNIQNIYNYLNEKDIKFFPLCFPFSENRFSNFVNEINKKRIGQDIVKYAIYEKDENYIRMILSDGKEVRGKIILDN